MEFKLRELADGRRSILARWPRSGRRWRRVGYAEPVRVGRRTTWVAYIDADRIERRKLREAVRDFVQVFVLGVLESN